MGYTLRLRPAYYSCKYFHISYTEIYRKFSKWLVPQFARCLLFPQTFGKWPVNWLLQISCTLKLNSFKRGKTYFSSLREFSFDFMRFIYDFFNGFGSWPKSLWPPWLFSVWKGPVIRDCRIDWNGTVLRKQWLVVYLGKKDEGSRKRESMKQQQIEHLAAGSCVNVCRHMHCSNLL